MAGAAPVPGRDKALAGAGRVGLPEDRRALARLVPADDLARFAAALVRVTLDKGVADDLEQHGRGQARTSSRESRDRRVRA